MKIVFLDMDAPIGALGQVLSAQADDTEYDNIANSTSAEELRAIVQVLADRIRTS